MSEFKTDFAMLPSGLYVPPGLAKAADQERDQRRRELDRRFFAADQKTGKFFTTFGQYGNATVGGAMEKPRDTPNYAALRRLYAASAIDKLIVLARKHQIRYVSRKALVPEREIGWRVVHKQLADPNFENTDDIERRCRHMEEIVERVNTKIVPGGFRAFLLMMVEDELIYDRKAMIIARDWDDLPAAYWTADPTTIKPRIEALAPWMVKNGVPNYDAAAERYSYEIYARGVRDGAGKEIDLTTADYVQELEGQIVGAWQEHEISIDTTSPVNQIDHYFYGRGVFEDSIEWTGAFMATFNYNANWFRSKVPEQLIFLAGEVDPEGYDAFQKQLSGQGTGGTYDHRVAVITGDKEFKVQAQPMRATMQEMAFPAWLRVLIAGKAGCYRMDPRIINFDLASGNDQNMFKTSSREEQLSLSEEQGFHTLAHNLEDWINRCLVSPRYDDLVFRFVGLERPPESSRMEIINAKQVVGTLNELRNESGALPPIMLPGYPDIGNVPLNPSILPIMQYMDQKRMMEQQMGQERAAQQYSEERGGGGMAPASPDTSNAPSEPGSSPQAGQQPASAGGVMRQVAGAEAGKQQSSTTKSFTVLVNEIDE